MRIRVLVGCECAIGICTAGLAERAMQLNHISAARPLMQAVHVLRDQRELLMRAQTGLALRQRNMRRIGLGAFDLRAQGAK